MNGQLYSKFIELDRHEGRAQRTQEMGIYKWNECQNCAGREKAAGIQIYKWITIAKEQTLYRGPEDLFLLMFKWAPQAISHWIGMVPRSGLCDHH